MARGGAVCLHAAIDWGRSRRHELQRATLVLGVCLLAGGTAFAQDRGDVSGGYRFIRSEGVNYGAGWYFDVTGHVTEVVSVVGDVGGSYKGVSETFAGITVDADVRIHTFAGGVKVRAANVHPHLLPFGQVLFGFGRARASASAFGITESESATDPLLSLGGGVDVSGGTPVGVRVHAGWVRVFADTEGSNAFQLSIGAKFRF